MNLCLLADVYISYLQFFVSYLFVVHTSQQSGHCVVAVQFASMENVRMMTVSVGRITSVLTVTEVSSIDITILVTAHA